MKATTAHQHPRLTPLRGRDGAPGGDSAHRSRSGSVRLPDVEGMLEDASRTAGELGLPGRRRVAFLETAAFVGLVVPGETAVVVGGVVAERGDVELIPLIGLVWLAAAAGDAASFLLGRRLGRPFLERHGPRLRLGPERLTRVERFYDRHGGKAVLVGRFAGLVRAVSPFLAGASGLSLGASCPGASPAHCCGRLPSPSWATASRSRSPSRARHWPRRPSARRSQSLSPSWRRRAYVPAAGAGSVARATRSITSAQSAPRPAPTSAPASTSSGKCTRR